MNCKSCGNTTSSFGLTFWDQLCSACHSQAEMGDSTLMRKNEIFLSDILNQSKKKRTKGMYDCIVPVRGDAEDYYTIKFLMERNVDILVVFVNNFFLNDIGWMNYQNLITEFDLDSVTFSPNLDTYKNLVAESLRKLDSIYYPYKSIQHSYVMQEAIEKRIPLIIWGQCQPLEFSGKFSRSDRLFLSKWWIEEHELLSCSPKKFFSSGSLLDQTTVSFADYPSDNDTSRVQSIFLSNFLPWDQYIQNSEALNYGFTPELQKNTFDNLENAGSSVYYQMHDLLRLKRIGLPKISEHLSRETRFGRLTREDNLRIRLRIERYLSYQIETFFLDFLGTTKSGLDWFIKNNLSRYKHLIRSQPECSIVEEMSNCHNRCMATDWQEPRQHFVKFMKAI